MTINREQIKQVFLAHGFTVKPGQDDLKEYVYAAAEALIAQAQAAPEAEPVEVVAYLNSASGEVVKYGPTLMDWDDEKEPVESLMTVAQHSRIVAAQRIKTCIALKERNDARAATTAPQHDAGVIVCRESLARWKDDCGPGHPMFEELRALLAQQEAKP